VSVIWRKPVLTYAVSVVSLTASVNSVNSVNFASSNLTWVDKDFPCISGIIFTHFKAMLLSYYKLEWRTRCPFVLGHTMVNSHFRYKSIRSSTEYSSNKKLDWYRFFGTMRQLGLPDIIYYIFYCQFLCLHYMWLRGYCGILSFKNGILRFSYK